MAGTAVDTALFPLDTLKTRLQSKAGFAASGGFRGVYSGLTSAVIGSAPGASMFFVTYEGLKTGLSAVMPGPQYAPVVHMISASGGEIAACFVRVPTEVIKQRMQTKQYKTTTGAVKAVIQNEGILGFYRGYFSTVAREIPFTCIQFPLYEYMKNTYAFATHRTKVDPWEAAICGSIAGGVAAGITTPLDVIKTRVMLSQRSQAGSQSSAYYSGIISTFKRILTEEGPRALFSGIGPRVMWISIGGSIFLGVYEKAKVIISRE
ncbi:mitochondrial carrier domain-containing protein [Lobosporangium transversale]|uniref:Mitochondrial carrier domain-containing protein n=1 Tax=Lobosporangium transversale TaxID=64571 RepID=A0A1Y2GAR7_9FUNG|nr:mitochondrial carrier domain-containing protein [Lobosporangium transversale]ORZ04049.1 mitochondrial carrier domain-containing protein [Lobosporangium transversale]|eukprot:XP_021876326.1 mitochondrial carrier domain-containing protein [Lobosporangium transversale]